MSQSPEYTPERRPINSRDRALSKRIAHWLVERRITPNAISMAGMFAGIAAGIAFAMTAVPHWSRLAFLAAAVFMQLRLLANMLDGMVAMESDSASPLGELFNEVPDRISDAAMFVGAGYAVGSSPVLGYQAACLAIFVAYVRAEGKVAGAPQFFSGPLAKPQRVFVMTVTALLCAAVSTSLFWRVADAEFVTFSFGPIGWVLLLCEIGMVATAIRRLRRIANHLRQEAI